MCGIAVMVGLQGRQAEPTVIQRMMTSLAHRGPNDEGLYVSGAVGFGFRRLSIFDLSSLSHQPMVSDDGRYAVVFNGAIYNYIELRNELRQFGHEFRSTGDTEVLLKAYQQWGADCLSKFNGMWAFVVYDRARQVLFGSRDHFGKKPLYYFKGQDTFFFASEIKAICASGTYQPTVNWKIAAQFLLEGQLDHTRETFYEGIQQVPAGTAFELDLSGRWKEWRYWSLSETYATGSGDPVQTFSDLFDDAVRLRMRSDVPVGISLSGGLDSTSILTTMVRQQSDAGAQPFHAFIYQAEGFDESRYLKETLALTHAQSHKVQVKPRDLWDRLREVLWHHDEPVHTLTAAVGFEIYRVASAFGVRVMQTGQGADETLAGYPTYFLDAWASMLVDGRVAPVWESIRAYTAVHGGSAAVLLRHWAWQLHSFSAYRRVAAWKTAWRIRANPWFSRELNVHWREADIMGDERSLSGALRDSVSVSSLPLYLRVEDRNAMAHAVESRLPFLDHRLVEFAFSLSSDWKINGPWTKVILREAMRGRIPESIRMRSDKMGFPTPSTRWIAGELSGPIRDILESRAVRERGIYNPRVILKDLDRHRAGEIDVAQRLFHVVEMEMLFELMSDSSRGERAGHGRPAEIAPFKTTSSIVAAS